MRVVTALSDRIVVLDQGRVLAAGQSRRSHGARRRRRRLPGGAACLSARPARRLRRGAGAVGRLAYDRRRELVCVLGPNGAGKTTLINAIAGLHPVQLRHARHGRAATCAASPPHRFCAAGIAHRPRRTPAVHAHERTREPRDRQLPAHGTQGTQPNARVRVHAVPAGARQARRVRRLAFGRAAADGGDRPRLDGETATATPRRALARAVARDGDRDVPRHSRSARCGNGRAAESSRTWRWRWMSPTARTSSRKAGSSPKARPTTCSTTPSCAALTWGLPRNVERRAAPPRATAPGTDNDLDQSLSAGRM